MLLGRLPKWLRWVLVALVLVAAVAFILAWKYWDNPALDRRVRELADSREVRIEGQPFGFSPLRGLLLQDSKVRFSLPNGAAVFRIPRARVTLDFFRLDEEVKCRTIYADRAEIGFLLGPATKRKKQPAPPGSGSPDPDPTYSTFAPERLTFARSSLALYEPGKKQALLTLDGFESTLEKLTLASPFPDNLFESLMGSGEIRAGRTRMGSAEYSDLSGRFELLGGTLKFQEMRFKAPAGDFHLDRAEIELSSGAPTLKGLLSAPGIADCRRLAPDLLQGLSEPVKGRLVCDLKGTLTPPQGDCTLVLEVAGREVGKIPFIHRTVRLVLPKQRSVIAKGPWIVKFKVRDSTYEIQDVSLETDGPSFLLEGRIVEDTLNLNIDVLIPKSKLRPGTFPPPVLSELSAGPDRIRFPFVVAGTSTAPEAELRRKDLSYRAFAELKAFLQFRTAFEGFAGDLVP